MKPRRKKMQRLIALFLATNILFQSLSPMRAFALTSGPAQPEFSSFEPVATTNMVNDFTGSFTYNLPVLDIPGANGGGYAMSLSYHSGTSPEEESSWVGYGWSLNPGAINRNKRGFPDDVKSQHATYWNKMPKNWTVSAGGRLGVEVFGFYPSAGAAVRYNNYKGYGYTIDFGLSYKGLASLGYAINDGKGSFSAGINPAGILSRFASDNVERKNEPSVNTKNASFFDKWKSLEAKRAVKGLSQSAQLLGNSSYGIFTYGNEMRTTRFSTYEGQSFNFSVGLQGDPLPLPAGFEPMILGNYTQQMNMDHEDETVYGYMYSQEAKSSGNTTMMDYYMEKDAPYEKRAHFLAIPFNNSDNYMLTGEGLTGGFKMYNKRAGHYRPNAKTSSTQILQLGASIHLGTDIGGGANVGYGVHTLAVNEWNGLSSFATSSDDEPNFFRFNNDLGGNVAYAATGTSETTLVQAEQASINGGGVRGVKSYDPILASAASPINGGLRSGRSSYIAYHTNAEMANTANGYGYKRYSQNAYPVNRNDAQIQDGVGEFAVFNEEGNRYVYGLPVYARNEKNMQYSLEGSSGGVQNNYFTTTSINSGSEAGTNVQVGEEHNYPYAASYLLTEITTPDYVDRTLDGPSDDDFGGYTKFNYSQLYGSSDAQSMNDASANWYKWRSPYSGLRYNKNTVSDVKDDVGSVSTGEKEVYYLNAVETKTHIALFYTSDRTDGLEAADNATAAGSYGAKGTNKLKKLDMIRLYAKATDGSGTRTLLKTIHFAYDYTVQAGGSGTAGIDYLPNTTTAGSGKLTLKKVWFEYEGIANAKISPYVFFYEYPKATDFSSEVLSRYPNVVPYMTAYNTADQLPPYSPFNIDSWGNYQYNGAARYAAMRPWVSQEADDPHFDPAAGQLKKIQLPSGGQILIQYEQNDYCYVQDRRAMGMVRIDNYTVNANDITYNLKLTDLNVAAPSAELTRLRNLIYDEYITKGRKIYFKFLYQLFTNSGSTPCNHEYLTGYVNVIDVGIDSNNQLYIKIDKSHGPTEVCEDFANAERSGMDLSSCAAPGGGVTNDGDPESMVRILINKALGAIPGSPGICASIDPANSFLRVPLSKAKKGGGVRVKRVLTYDNGIETGDANLYGSEYIYKTYDAETQQLVSSGVATNEPVAGREENALIGFAYQFESSWLDKLVGGDNKKQVEGPLGESILPGPSVGYSRIVTKGINDGGTNTGFTVNEYFTAKDYPYDKYYSQLGVNGVNMTGINEESDWMLIPAGLVNYSVSNLWLSQGFSFIQNSMHGQIKKSSTYAGDYSNINKWILTASQEYTYFEPGESVPMMRKIGDVQNDMPGREMEMAYESRSVEDVGKDGNIEVDITAGIYILFVIPFATAIPSVSYSESKLKQHTTSKLFRYPAILKSVKTLQDGAYTTTENMVFDKATGKPIVKKYTDEFGGTLVSQDIPAHMLYPNMGQKATNERAIYSNVAVAADGSYFELNNTSNTCAIGDMFAVGDELRITQTGGACTGYYTVNTLDERSGRVYISPSGIQAGTSCALSSVDKIEVLKSGFTNQLGAKAGSIAFHTAPTVTPTYYNGITNNFITSDNFVTDLNNQLNTISVSTATSGTLTLSGTYTNMTLPTDVCVINGLCSGANGLTLTNVKIEYTISGDQLLLRVISLDATDPVTTKHVSIDCATQPSFASNGTDVISIPMPQLQAGRSNARTTGFQCNLPPASYSTFVSQNCDFLSINHHTYLKYSLGNNTSQRMTDNISISAGTPIGFSFEKEINTVSGCPYTEYPNNFSQFWFKVYIEFTTPSGVKIPGESNFMSSLDNYSTGNSFCELGLYQVAIGYKYYNHVWPSGIWEREYFNAFFCVEPPPVLDFLIDENLGGGYHNLFDPSNVCVGRPKHFDAYVLAGIPPCTNEDSHYEYEWSISPNTAQINSNYTSGIDLICNQLIPYYTLTLKTRETKYHASDPPKITTKRIIPQDCNTCQTLIVGPDNIPIPSDNITGCFGYSSPVTYNLSHPPDNNCPGDNCTYTLTDPDGLIATVNNNLASLNCNSTIASIEFNKVGTYLLKAVVNGGAGQTSYTKVIHTYDARPAAAHIAMSRPTCPDKEITFTAEPVCGVHIDSYAWDFGDGTTSPSGGPVINHTYKDCLPHDITLAVSNKYNTSPISSGRNYSGNGAEENACHPFCECVSGFTLKGLNNVNHNLTSTIGQFYLNTATGIIVFKQNGCDIASPLNCIQKCSTTPLTIPNVIQATTTEYANSWPYDPAQYQSIPTGSANSYSANANTFETGAVGKWRPVKIYTYKSLTSQRDENTGGKRIYNAGTYNLQPFDYTGINGGNDPAKWILANTSTRYSPNGVAEEEQDVLNIYSSVKYGYKQTMPVVVAQNASSNAVQFEGFEESSGAAITTAYSHSGKKALHINQSSYTVTQNIDLTKETANEDLLIRFWCMQDPGFSLALRVNNNRIAPLKKIAQTGNWSLYEGRTTSAGMNSNHVTLSFETVLGNTDYYIDDVVIQPVKAHVSCYVYDPVSLKLLTSFDDQHFGTYYQYNAEGQLVRKMAETEKGIKTVQETQYNTPKVAR